MDMEKLAKFLEGEGLTRVAIVFENERGGIMVGKIRCSYTDAIGFLDWGKDKIRESLNRELDRAAAQETTIN